MQEKLNFLGKKRKIRNLQIYIAKKNGSKKDLPSIFLIKDIDKNEKFEEFMKYNFFIEED